MSEPQTNDSNPFDLDDDAPLGGAGPVDAPNSNSDEDDEQGDDGEDEDEPADDDSAAASAREAEEAARAKKESEELAEQERARAAARSRSGTRPGRREPETVTEAPEPRPSKMLVRIKPFNLKRGHTMRTHSRYHDGQRATFMEGKGWYEVDHGLADTLRSVRCSDMDPESSLAFDVCTPKEARRLDERAEVEAERESRATAHRPRSATS